MINELTYEQKAVILKSNGWTDLWHKDNWVKNEWFDRGLNVDWMGYSTDQALEEVMKYD